MRKSLPTLEEIKSELNNYVGIELKLRENKGRNKIKFFDGKIINLYPSIFVVETMDKEIKSYNYFEIVSGVIKMMIKPKEENLK